MCPSFIGAELSLSLCPERDERKKEMESCENQRKETEKLKGERAVGLWECELVRVSVLREMKERNGEVVKIKEKKQKLKGERAVGVIWND
ncbi:hypothetical protein ACB092_04G192200 [Castanea dentata]